MHVSRLSTSYLLIPTILSACAIRWLIGGTGLVLPGGWVLRDDSSRRHQGII